MQSRLALEIVSVSARLDCFGKGMTKMGILFLLNQLIKGEVQTRGL